MRFSERPCARRAIWPRRARACSARSRCCRRPPPSYVDLGITYLRAGELDKALGQFEAGLNLPSPSLPAPDWDCAIAGLRQALAAKPGAELAQRHTTSSACCSAATGAQSSEVAAEFREAIRLRPDFAEAHNHLGLVLIQAGDDEAGIAALREAVRISPDYADAHANLGAALTPTNADGSDPRAREGRRAGAGLCEGAVQPGGRLWRQSRVGGPAKEIEQLRKVIELAPTFARAHLALGKALLRDGQGARRRRGPRRKPRGSSRRAAKPTISSVWLWRARDARKKPRPSSRRAASSSPPTIATRTRNLDIAEGRAALEKGDLEEAAAKFRRAHPAPPGLVRRAAATSRWCSRSQGAARRRTTRSGSRSSKATFDEGKFKEVEPLLAEYVQAASEVVVGLVRARLQPVRAAEDRRIDQRAGEVSRARHPKRRGAQDPRPQSDDHRAIRRRPGRVRAGASATSRTPPRSTTTSASSFRSRTTGSRRGRRSTRRFGSIPSYVEALDALGFALEALGDDAGAIAKYEKAIALNDDAQGQLRLRPREPERLLQSHGRSGQGARVRSQGDRARSEVRPRRGFRRAGPTSARGTWTTRSTR